MRTRYLLVSGLVIATYLSSAMAGTGPEGENCELTEPPKAAGDIFTSVGPYTQVAKIFPRLSDIGPSYSGCQVAWMSNTPDFAKVSVLRIQISQGKAVAIWPPSSIDPMCAKGESAKATGCQYPAHYLAASAFPGCAGMPKQGGQMPPHCSAELFREMDIRNRHVEQAERENAP